MGLFQKKPAMNYGNYINKTKITPTLLVQAYLESSGVGVFLKLIMLENVLKMHLLLMGDIAKQVNGSAVLKISKQGDDMAGKIIYVIAMGWTLIIYGGLTYLFARKKDYSLLSGYSRRPEEEKQYLEESGYLAAMGKLFTITFWLLAVTFVLGLLPISFGFEIGISGFLIWLLSGMVWIQRYEVPDKRKKMTWITGSISVATLVFIVGLTGVGYLDNEVTVNDDTFKISGMYGIEWEVADIEHVELRNDLPKVIMKTNGSAAGNILKGRFKLENLMALGLFSSTINPFQRCFMSLQITIMS